jgi:hypothetical protein
MPIIGCSPGFFETGRQIDRRGKAVVFFINLAFKVFFPRLVKLKTSMAITAAVKPKILSGEFFIICIKKYAKQATAITFKIFNISRRFLLIGFFHIIIITARVITNTVTITGIGI